MEPPTHIVTSSQPVAPPKEPVWQKRVKDSKTRERYHMTGREVLDFDFSNYRSPTVSRDVIRNNGVRETVLTTDGVMDDMEQNEFDSFIPAKPSRRHSHHHRNSLKRRRENTVNPNLPTPIEEWRLLQLAFDKICFVLTTVLLSGGFILMITTDGESLSEADRRNLAD